MARESRKTRRVSKGKTRSTMGIMPRFENWICYAASLLVLNGCGGDSSLSKPKARADHGEAEAQYQVAQMYEEGKSAAKDAVTLALF
jgi:TPR repeat protein